MKNRMLWVVFALACLAGVNACNFFKSYSQSYVILLGTRQVGKEVVSEKTDLRGNRVCLSEQEMTPPNSSEKRVIRTRMVIPKEGRFPVSYAQESGEDNSYEMKLDGEQILRTGGGAGESRTPFLPDMLLLNPTAFHTLDYWIRHYDLRKGGQQFFRTYLLPGGAVERVSVFPLDADRVESGGKKIELKNYRVEFEDGLTLLVWVDGDARLCRALMEGAGLDVIRSDFYEAALANRDR